MNRFMKDESGLIRDRITGIHAGPEELFHEITNLEGLIHAAKRTKELKRGTSLDIPDTDDEEEARRNEIAEKAWELYVSRKAHPDALSYSPAEALVDAEIFIQRRDAWLKEQEKE